MRKLFRLFTLVVAAAFVVLMIYDIATDRALVRSGVITAGTGVLTILQSLQLWLERNNGNYRRWLVIFTATVGGVVTLLGVWLIVTW
jgi:hypothetical protein